jgi:hypothetical protein
MGPIIATMCDRIKSLKVQLTQLDVENRTSETNLKAAQANPETTQTAIANLRYSPADAASRPSTPASIDDLQFSTSGSCRCRGYYGPRGLCNY